MVLETFQGIRKHPSSPHSATTEMIPMVPQIITQIRKSMQRFMVPPKPVTCGLSQTRPRPKTQLGAQSSAGAVDTLWF
jgi:hypothetical protein